MKSRAWIGLLPLVLAGCGREIRTDAAEAAAVLSAASPPPIPTSASANGVAAVLYSEHDAETRTRNNGVVAAIHVDLGDNVRAGQLLATLRDEREAAGVASARAAVEMAAAAHARTAELRKKDLVTDAELEQAVFRLRAAEAALREAEVLLEYTRVRAPFAGAIAHRFVRVGQYVEEDAPLFRVSAPTPLRARVLVPELQAVGLKRGQTLRMRGVDGAVVAAHITRTAPAVDPVSGTVEVLLDVREPGSLRPGSSATVELPQNADPPRATSETRGR